MLHLPGHLRFYEQRSQQEIADAIGINQAQVSRILIRVLTDLRKELGLHASVA